MGSEVFEMKVVESRQITPSIHKILLKKPGTFEFLPVQFTFLSLLTQEGMMDTRPMSIATSPTRPNLEYAVRLSDSFYKKAFASLKPGDNVTVQGPYGDFILDQKTPSCTRRRRNRNYSPERNGRVCGRQKVTDPNAFAVQQPRTRRNRLQT